MNLAIQTKPPVLMVFLGLSLTFILVVAVLVQSLANVLSRRQHRTKQGNPSNSHTLLRLADWEIDISLRRTGGEHSTNRLNC